MRHRRHRKENWMLFLLGACVCICMGALAWAMPYWNNIDSYRCTLSISDGTARVDASVVGSSGSSQVAVHAILQRREGRRWVDVAGWWDVQEGVRAAVSGAEPVSSGETYRVWMQAEASRNGRTQREYVTLPPKTA